MTREPRTIWIGIQGGTCSGKTTIAQTLASYLDPTDTLILGLDQFYFPVEKEWLKNWPTRNFDDPSSLDWNSFRHAALTLEAGLTAEVALYDGLSMLGYLHLEPRSYIIVEGLWALADESVVDLFDLAVYIETSSDIRLIRRIERDVVRSRECTLEQLLGYYLERIRPMHLKYVEPAKDSCDLVVSGEQDSEHEAKRIIETLQRKRCR